MIKQLPFRESVTVEAAVDEACNLLIYGLEQNNRALQEFMGIFWYT